MWYDLFAAVYDPALESLYAPFRPAAVAALRLRPGDAVLDVPCGTGQSLGLLAEAAGPDGAVLGVDRSAGMLQRARRRVERAGWTSVHLRQRSADDVDAGGVEEGLGTDRLDGVHCALGLTALDEWEATFHALFGLLRPGGRFVLLDVHAAERTLATRTVELVARADLSRRAWEPLAAVADGFERVVFADADPQTFGGALYVAAGTKPG